MLREHYDKISRIQTNVGCFLIVFGLVFALMATIFIVIKGDAFGTLTAGFGWAGIGYLFLKE